MCGFFLLTIYKFNSKVSRILETSTTHHQYNFLVNWNITSTSSNFYLIVIFCILKLIIAQKPNITFVYQNGCIGQTNTWLC
jgi:hypothetical protein